MFNRWAGTGRGSGSIAYMDTWPPGGIPNCSVQSSGTNPVPACAEVTHRAGQQLENWLPIIKLTQGDNPTTSEELYNIVRLFCFRTS